MCSHSCFWNDKRHSYAMPCIAWFFLKQFLDAYACGWEPLLSYYLHPSLSINTAHGYWENRRLTLNEFHEFFAGFGLIEDAGEVGSNRHGMLFLDAAHLHTEVLCLDDHHHS